MIIDQALIVGILSKTFVGGGMICQERGQHIEFTVLAGRIASELNKYITTHERMTRIDVEIDDLEDEKDKLIYKCGHIVKRTTDTGNFCQICGKVFEDKVSNAPAPLPRPQC